MPLWGSSSRPKDLGPFYIKKYPQGFQPMDAERSLNTAFDKVKEICTDIDEKRKSNSKNLELGIAYSKLKGIRDLVEAFQRAINDEEDLRQAFNAFTAGMDEIDVSLSINGPEACTAACALADVMEITRKSIPNAFEDVKKGITAKRDKVVEKIRDYEAGPTMGRDTSSPTGTASVSESDSEDDTPRRGPG